MTLILLEGFDTYSTATDLTTSGKWNTQVSNGFNTSTVRTGAQSFNIDGGQLTKIVAAAEEDSTFICGFAFNAAQPLQIVFNSDSNTITHVLMSINSTGLHVYRGPASALLGEYINSTLITSNWHYVELKALLSDTVGTIQVWLDGYSVLSLTNVDTKNGGTKTVFDTMSITGVNTIKIDDIYFCNGAGSFNNDRLGEIRVRTLFPNADGNYSQFLGSDGNSTNNYLLVDDLLTNSGAQSDYVEDSVTNDIDTYNFQNLTETSGNIIGVQIGTVAQKTDAGARSVAHVTRVSSTDYASSDIALSTGFGYQKTIVEKNPNTSAAWTISEINAAEFGVKAR